MTPGTIFSYIFFGILAVVNIIVAFGMKKKYPHAYLSTLFYYVLLFSVGNFATRILLKTLLRLIDLSEWQMAKFSGFNFVFVLWPLAIIGMFLMIKFVNEMLGKKVSARFKWVYFSSWGLYCSAALLFFLHLLNTREIGFHNFMVNLMMVELADMAGIVIRFYTMAYLVNRSREIKDAAKGQAFMGFGILWLLGLLVFNLGGVFLAIRESVLIFLSISYILPALLYLNRYLKKDIREHPSLEEKGSTLQHVFAEYNISKREQEVIDLISRGKSNLEISNHLYISLSTVKLHIHSIYRKLNIKNRVQLSNFIRNSVKN